jgi:hypothetical protein
MDQVALLLALAFAADKVVSVLKGLAAKDWNLALTQILVWVIAFGVVCLAGAAEVTETYVPPGLNIALGDLDFWSLLLLGIVVGSTGSIVFDFRKAIDSTDSAQEPKLFHTPPPPQ